MKDLGAGFRGAMRDGLITLNPFAGHEVISTDDSVSRLPFTLEEVGQLLSVAPSQEWRGLILVAAFTGLRLGDASRLTWGAIDMESELIELIPSKTKRKKRRVRIPIQSDLLFYLQSVRADIQPADSPVFPRLSSVAIGSRSGLSQTFNRIMKEAGVDRGKPSRVVKAGEKTAGRINYEKGFHSLRHTFTTWLRTAGVSEEDRMSLTGHSTRDSHAIYSHVDEAALKSAISKLPNLKNERHAG
jgi:Site-specific recombinase XerD